MTKDLISLRNDGKRLKLEKTITPKMKKKDLLQEERLLNLPVLLENVGVLFHYVDGMGGLEQKDGGLDGQWRCSQTAHRKCSPRTNAWKGCG